MKPTPGQNVLLYRKLLDGGTTNLCVLEKMRCMLFFQVRNFYLSNRHCSPIPHEILIGTTQLKLKVKISKNVGDSLANIRKARALTFSKIRSCKSFFRHRHAKYHDAHISSYVTFVSNMDSNVFNSLWTEWIEVLTDIGCFKVNNTKVSERHRNYRSCFVDRRKASGRKR